MPQPERRCAVRFGSRRRGWRWEAYCVHEDGIARPLASHLRYWRKLSADREAMTALSVHNGALWSVGCHWLQQDGFLARARDAVHAWQHTDTDPDGPLNGAMKRLMHSLPPHGANTDAAA